MGVLYNQIEQSTVFLSLSKENNEVKVAELCKYLSIKSTTANSMMKKLIEKNCRLFIGKYVASLNVSCKPKYKAVLK